MSSRVSKVDPLTIVNEFMQRTADVPLMHEYWERRLCALAVRTADAENELAELKYRQGSFRRLIRNLSRGVVIPQPPKGKR